MTGVHVITSGNRHLNREVLDDYHALRHNVFIRERGWADLKSSHARETDSYDDEHAVYLVALKNGHLVGGQRLYPTARPHMLSEVFPHLVQRDALPVGADIYECSRFCVRQEDRGGPLNNVLLAALQEFGLSQNIRQVTAVVETRWFRYWRRIGYRFRALGPPAIIAGETCGAVVIDVSPENLARVRRLAGIRGEILVNATVCGTSDVFESAFLDEGA